MAVPRGRNKLGTSTRFLPVITTGVVVFLTTQLMYSKQCRENVAYGIQAAREQRAGNDLPLGSAWFPGAQPLPAMAQHCADKVDEARFQAYTAYHPSIHGWMADSHPGAVKSLTMLQRKKCIVGSVGEIGTHHGRFFFALASTAASTEKLLAIDLYEDQDKNIDASGGTDTGKRAEFLKHAKALGWPEGSITVVSADSTTLSPSNFSAMRFPAFRLFSVDGGHAYETTMNDMELVARIMHPGGIMIVDDFVNPGWLGVMDAVVTFLRTTQTQFVPFLWTCTKIYFCHRSHHSVYLDFVRSGGFDCTSRGELRPPSYSLAGVQLCVEDPKGCTWSGKQ